MVVTRAPGQAGGLAAELEQFGAEVLYLPLVRFESATDKGPLQGALNRLAEFDWLLLTSQNAVRFVAEGLREMPEGGPASWFPKVAAVGTATAEAARQVGWPVDFVASRFRGAALAEELGERVRGKKVLLPRSDRARPDLPAALRELGAEVHEVVAYRTVTAESAQSEAASAIRAGRVDVITFASPSAVHGFVDVMGEEARALAAGAKIAVIGQVTAEAVREAGMTAHIEAEESTASGLARAIAGYFEQQRISSGARSR